MRRRIMFIMLPIMCVVVLAGASLGMWFFGPLSAQNQTGTGVQVEGMGNFYGLVTIPNKNDIKIVVHQKGIQLNQQIRVEYDPDSYNYVEGTMDLLYDVYVPVEVDKYIAVHSNRLTKLPGTVNYPLNESNGSVVHKEACRYSGNWEFQGSKQVNDPNKPGQMKTIYTFVTELEFEYQHGMKPIDEADVNNIFNILQGNTILAKFEIKPKAGTNPGQ